MPPNEYGVSYMQYCRHTVLNCYTGEGSEQIRSTSAVIGDGYFTDSGICGGRRWDANMVSCLIHTCRITSIDLGTASTVDSVRECRDNQERRIQWSRLGY